ERIIEKRVKFLRLQLLIHPSVEIRSPAEGLGLRVPVDLTKVMDHVPAAHDEDPLIAQRTKLGGQVEVVLKRFFQIDTQLDHRNIGVRIEMPEDRPGSVIEPPGMMIEMNLRLGDELTNGIGDLG